MESFLNDTEYCASVQWQRALALVVREGFTGQLPGNNSPRARSYFMPRLVVSPRLPFVEDANDSSLYPWVTSAVADFYRNTLRHDLHLEPIPDLLPRLYDIPRAAMLLNSQHYAPLLLLGKPPYRWQGQNALPVVHAHKHPVSDGVAYVNLSIYVPLLDAYYELQKTILLYAVIAHHLALTARLSPGMLFLTVGALSVKESSIPYTTHVVRSFEPELPPSRLGRFSTVTTLYTTLTALGDVRERGGAKPCAESPHGEGG